jgi:thiol-disulfide isomerase/thioredoxin
MVRGRLNHGRGSGNYWFWPGWLYRRYLCGTRSTATQLIIVKFVAPYCPACETLKPVLHQIAEENTGKVHLVELDMSEEPELAINYGVRSAPTVILVKQQQTLAQIAGLKPKKQYADTDSICTLKQVNKCLKLVALGLKIPALYNYGKSRLVSGRRWQV